jgi:Putative peptidoglycan binding domain/Peptidase M15
VAKAADAEIVASARVDTEIKTPKYGVMALVSPASPRRRRHGSSSTVALQRALRLLGWPIRVDGRYGVQTADAVRDFQRGYAFSTLVASGSAGPRTRAALKTAIRRGGRCSQHFSFRAFRSPGDGWIKLDRALVRGLEAYRAELGEHVTIVAGYRDAAWHAAHGGAPGSQHPLGTAADVEPALTLEQVHALRVFSGIRYDHETGLVHHVDVRHVGPAPDGATPANPTVWT